MALTLEAEQRLKRAKLIDFFDASRRAWETVVRDTYLFVKQQFPSGSVVRQDDVAKTLRPIVEVHEGLRSKLDAGKLKQRYWVSHFTDLVIDRCWDAASTESDDDQAGKGAARL